MNHEIKQYRVKSEQPTLVRWIVLILLLWLFALIQAAFLSYVPLFGATIELTAAFVLLIAWKRGPLVGGILGMIGGCLLDALMGQRISLLALILFGLGVYAALAAKRLFDRPLSYLLMTLPAYVILGVWRAISMAKFSHVFAVIFVGILASLIVYFPTLVKYFRRKS